jgi:hypothetical protein
MMFPNIKEKQLNINGIHAMGSFQLLNSLIIKKTFKNIKLLNKQLNDNIQMCCQLILDLFFKKLNILKHHSSSTKSRTFNRQLDVL